MPKIHVHCYKCYEWYEIDEEDLPKWVNRCPKCAPADFPARHLPDYPYTKGSYTISELEDVLKHAVIVWHNFKDDVPDILKDNLAGFVSWQITQWADGDGLDHDSGDVKPEDYEVELTLRKKEVA